MEPIVHQPINNGFYHPPRRASPAKAAAPAPAESRNWLIYRYYATGRIDRADDVLKLELERSRGRNEYAHYVAGMMHMDKKMYVPALEKFQTCNKLNPASIDYIKQIGKCLFLQKRYKLSLEAYMEAENLSKRLDWEIHYAIAECLIRLGGFDAALQWSKRSAAAGKQLDPCKQLGKLLVRKGDYKGAIEAYNMALESSPESSDILTSVGLLHARLGQQQLAVERLGSALAVGQPLAAALLPLAAIIQSHGDYDVALSKYKIAAQQTPDCAALWNNIGMCFFGKQKIIAAISCLKRATVLSPLSTRILHNLGLVHLISQQYSSAFQFLCASLNLKSGSASTLMLMAITLEQLQDYGNALKAYDRALEASPDNVTIRLNYSLFLHRQAQHDLLRYHLSIVEELSRKINMDQEHADAIAYLKEALDSRNRSVDSANRDDPIYEAIGGGSLSERLDLDEDEV